MMRIAICDDEKIWRDTVKKYVEEYAKDKCCIKCDTYSNGNELIAAYEKIPMLYDLVISDIEMPEINGIDMCLKVRELDNNVLIVFLTSYDEYVKKCFKCIPYGFWDKPLDYDKFSSDMDGILRRVQRKLDCFSFSYKRKITRLSYEEILYLYSSNRVVNIVTENEVYKMNGKISEVFGSLSEREFALVNKSYIVNLFKIKQIGNGHVIMSDGCSINVSRALKKDFTNRYFKFLGREMLNDV